MINWAEGHLVHAHTTVATPVEECLRWLDEHPEVERRSVLPTGIASWRCSAASTRRTGCSPKRADRVAELG